MEDQFLDEEFVGETTYKKNFYDVMTKDEMWEWGGHAGPLMHTLYPEKSPCFSNSCPRADVPQPVLLQNVLVGSIAVRQMRVRQNGGSHASTMVDLGKPTGSMWSTPLLGSALTHNRWQSSKNCNCPCCTDRIDDRYFGVKRCDRGPKDAYRGLNATEHPYSAWITPNQTRERGLECGGDTDAESCIENSDSCDRDSATCDDKSFGGKDGKKYAHSLFRSEIKGSPIFNRFGRTPSFGYGGYGIELPRDRRQAEAVLKGMEADFVDNRTRVVSFLLNFYNNNTDIFTVMSISFYFDATGHVER